MNDAIEFKIPIGMIVAAVLMILAYGLLLGGAEGAAVMLLGSMLYTAVTLVAGVFAFMLIGAIFSMNFGMLHRALLKLTAIILFTVALSFFFISWTGLLIGLGIVWGLYWIQVNWLFEFEGKEGAFPALGLVFAQLAASIVLMFIAAA